MTPQEQQAFAQGFVEKCAEYGVDPELMAKEAGVMDVFRRYLKNLTGKNVGAAESLLQKNLHDIELNNALLGDASNTLRDIGRHSMPLNAKRYMDSGQAVSDAIDAANASIGKWSERYTDRMGRSWASFDGVDFRKELRRAVNNGDFSLVEKLINAQKATDSKKFNDTIEEISSGTSAMFSDLKKRPKANADKYTDNLKNLKNETSGLEEKLLKEKATTRNTRLGTGAGVLGLGGLSAYTSGND